MVPRSFRVSYGVGAFGTATFSTVPGLLLLYYLTDALAVPPGLAGLAVLLPKVWDVFFNPVVGALSDRTSSRWGSRRPWMLAGAVSLPPCFALMFSAPTTSPGWSVLYVGGLFFAAATAYALFQVPYITLPGEVTSTYHERSVLMAYWVGMVGVAVLLSGVAAPAIVQASGESKTGYRVMGIIMAAVILAGMLGAFVGTARAHTVIRPHAETSIRAQWTAVRTYRPFRLALGMFTLQSLASAVMLAGVQYMATYILGEPDAVVVLFLCLAVPLMLTAPLWVRVSKHLGKRNAQQAANLTFAAMALLLVLIPVLPRPAIYLIVAVAGTAFAGMQMLGMSMLADMVAVAMATSGKQNGGVLTGLWTAGDTAGLALGPAVYSVVLAATGFIASDATRHAEQPTSAIMGVLVGATLIPALILLFCVPLIRRYDLTEAKVAALTSPSP